MAERLGGYDTLIVAGGDGSLGVAYNAVAAHPDLVVGYIPAGFGNATRHLLNLPREPEALVDVLVAGDARPIDLVEVDGRLALFASAGWDALVAGRYADAGARRLRGWASAAIRSVPDLWRRTAVEIRADGFVVHRGPMELAVVGTTPFYGRGLTVNPGARPDAGRLSLRVYPGPAPRFAAEAARWALRLRPVARRVDAQRVEINVRGGDDVTVQADGDVLGSRPAWSFALRAAAIRLIGRWA